MQKVVVVCPDDSRTVHYLNEFLAGGWIVKFVSEQRVSSGGGSGYIYGKIVYIIEAKDE